MSWGWRQDEIQFCSKGINTATHSTAIYFTPIYKFLSSATDIPNVLERLEFNECPFVAFNATLFQMFEYSLNVAQKLLNGRSFNTSF